MPDDLNPMLNNTGVPIVTPPFTHLSHQNPHLNSNINKKDDDRLFLHPSCINDNQRRMQETTVVPSNNGNAVQQQMSNVRFLTLNCDETNKQHSDLGR